MKKLVFEKIKNEKFNSLEIEKMKRVKGGQTLDTVTVYSSGGGSVDGSGCSDGWCND